MPSRRRFLQTATGALASGLILPKTAWTGEALLDTDSLPAGALASSELVALPGKQPLIKRTYRPPNYETPAAYFDAPFTPNDRFFVRYHHSAIPEIDPKQWKLRVGGEAAGAAVEFSLDELRRQFALVEVPALCLCAGNRRGLFQPHIPGVEWADGAMGNALWKGVRLRDVLNKARLKPNALEVVLDGADKGVLEPTPDFIKSLPLPKALDENTLIAFEMNGEPLPRWNGFPARLVVPGWAATYWIKHLTTINVAAQPFDGFWMKTAYRIPRKLFAMDEPFASQATDANTPITELAVNSLIIQPSDGQACKQGQTIELKGWAWDGGHGIARVEVSTDAGRTWQPAALGKDYGPYAWRQWSHPLTPKTPGQLNVMVRATNRAGHTQPPAPIANPAGYHHNAVQTLALPVA